MRKHYSLLYLLSILILLLTACTEPPKPPLPPVATVKTIGITPGNFTSSGGTFEISVLPLDASGNPITGGVSISNFSFKNVQATTVTNPNTVLSGGTVDPTKVDIIQATANQANTLVVDFDSSGSMSSNDRQRLRVVAGKSLVDTLDAGDQAAIIDFGAGRTGNFRASRLLQDFSSDKTLLKAAIDKVVASGGTPLYESLLDALDLLKVKPGVQNPTIVVLTDGQANGGERVQTVIDAAKAQQVPIFTIGLGNTLNFRELPNLAQQTGGTFAAANDADGLNLVFQNIGLSISQGRVIVTGTGLFASALPATGEYVVSGVLTTTIGGSSVDTPFSFRMSLGN
jgi:Ca-activated chloride channel homolog